MPRAPKACGHRDCDERVIAKTYCPTHQAEHEARPNTKARGYGHAHRTASEQARATMIDGSLCNRCGHPMFRTDKLSLDHDDHDRTKYRGLAHKRCNDQAGGLNTGWSRSRNT